MKKPTVEKDYYAFDPFPAFEQYEEPAGGPLNVSGSAAASRGAFEKSFGEKAGDAYKFLKQIFLFAPAALFPYGLTNFILYAVFVSKFSVFDFKFGIFMAFVCGLMTIVGLGRLDGLKSLLIPASISVVSIAVFAVSMILPEFLQTKLLFDYAPYFFPAVFIAPVLVSRKLK